MMFKHDLWKLARFLTVPFTMPSRPVKFARNCHTLWIFKIKLSYTSITHAMQFSQNESSLITQFISIKIYRWLKFCVDAENVSLWIWNGSLKYDIWYRYTCYLYWWNSIAFVKFTPLYLFLCLLIFCPLCGIRRVKCLSKRWCSGMDL